jgi:phosphoribosylanthranilate isomerase
MAQKAGADALGFNCYPGSPRYVSAAQAGELAAVTEVTRVALFVDPSEGEVEQVLRAADIDLLQFHGQESEAFCRGFGKPYMKVLRMRERVNFAAWAESYASAWALLLDAYVPGQPGGTGVQIDPQLWPRESTRRLVLAGGLTPDNVAGAIEALDPYGVDVAGGVEGSVKGHKDAQKTVKFVKEVRRVGRDQRQ